METKKYSILDLVLKYFIIFVAIAFLFVTIYFMIISIQIKKKQLETDKANYTLLQQLINSQNQYIDPLLKK